MPEEALNPYAPPLDEATAVEPSHLWSVQGDYLLVRPGTQLPPVDLEGDGAEPLTPVARRFSAIAGGGKGVLIAFLPSAVIIFLVVFAKVAFPGVGLWVAVIVVLLLSRLLGKSAKVSVTAMVWGYSSVKTLRTQARRNRWCRRLTALGLWLLVLSFGVVIGGTRHISPTRHDSFPFDDVLEIFVPTLLLSLVCLMTSAFWKALVPGLRCTAYRDGWLYLRGVPTRSLALLAGRAHEAPPVPRLRKVYKFYQYRLPLWLLIRNRWWNPWVVLFVSVLKARRSPKLERLHFHWSESSRRPAEEADPELVERWSEESEGTELASWTPLFAARNDSPQADMRMESLVHASPDRRHFSIMIVTRVVGPGYFLEVHQATLRSWTEDGRCFITSSPPTVAVGPENFDAEEVKGDLGKVSEAHFARLGNASVLAMPDEEALQRQLGLDAESQAAAYEAHGLQGSVEEMELRDPPR